MGHPLEALIEAKIAAAQEDGAFDGLEGEGQPLPSCVDPENILLSRVVREQGGAPEFVVLARELAALRVELQDTSAREGRQKIMKEMSMMEVKIDFARKAFSK
jgi:hypothetical protein